MNNKFLEFLINEKLKDITYSLKEISSERDKRFSNQLEEYPYLDDMFELFFKLDLTKEEIFNGLRKANYALADMLLGYETPNDKNRREKFNTFKPLIENNINFFKELFNICLTQHQHIKEDFKELNKELFIELVDIGINEGFFQQFSEQEKQTQILDYKEILIEKNVFEINYNLNETIKLITTNQKYQPESLISNHFSMYSSEIYKFLESLDIEKFNNFNEEISKAKGIKPEEETKPQQLKTLFNNFLYNLLKFERENFIPLLDNKFIKENLLIQDRYNNKSFQELITIPKGLEILLSKCDEYEKEKLFEIDTYSSGLVISHIVESSRDKIYVDEKLLEIILDNIDKISSKNEEGKKDMLITNILFTQAPKVQNKIFATKNFEKHTKNIVKSLTQYGNYETTFKYEERLSKFNDLDKDLDKNVWNKIKSKIEVFEKDRLYKFNQNVDSSQPSHDKLKLGQHLSKYITITKDIGVLNILNADPINAQWKNFKFIDNAKKTYNEENLVSYLLSKATTKQNKLTIVNWLVDESPNNFFDVKIGNKDIISYFFKEFENGIKNNPKSPAKEFIIFDILNYILEKEDKFNIILKNNKPKLKLVQSIEDEDIKKKINYYNLKQKLTSPKSKAVEQNKVIQKAKNKI